MPRAAIASRAAALRRPAEGNRSRQPILVLYASIAGRSSLSVAARLIHAATMAWVRRDPSVRQLCELLGLGPNTVVAARAELVAAGLVTFDRGERVRLVRRDGKKLALDGRAPSMKNTEPPSGGFVMLSHGQVAEHRGQPKALLFHAARAVFPSLGETEVAAIVGIAPSYVRQLKRAA